MLPVLQSPSLLIGLYMIDKLPMFVKKKKDWLWWGLPIILGICKVEAEELQVRGQSRQQ